MRNHFDVDRERREQTPDDWQFGALSQPGLASIPLNEREIYLPKGETQRGREDFQSCASISPVNQLEAQFTWLFRNNKLSAENKAWLEEKEYLNADGKITFSDRYIAVLSGTTRQGNSLRAPLEAIRKNGLIPKRMLPAHSEMSFDDYHKVSDITPAMKDLGQEFRNRFTINYEQVHISHFAEALKDDMLGVGAHAWPFPENGLYPRTDNPLNHAFMLYGLPKYQAYDSYPEKPDDYTKNLAPDYIFFETAYRVFISAESPYAKQVSLYQQLINILEQWLSALRSTPKPEPKPAPTNNLLNTLILAMRKHEGWFPGSRSQRNNNPLNCRYSSVGYHSMYGTVKRDPDNFAIFSSYELGHLYAKNLILQKAKKHPDWNLIQFIGDEREGWAPASDNNDVRRYSEVLAQALNTTPETFRLSQLL